LSNGYVFPARSRIFPQPVIAELRLDLESLKRVAGSADRQ
jgi:hypothetical protein